MESEGDERLYLPLCGITHCLPDYHISRDDSRYCVFEYIIRGSGYYRSGTREYHPQAGDVYIVHFGSNHEYGTSPDHPWEKIWFNFQGTLVNELLKLYQLDQVYYLPNSGLEQVFHDSFEFMCKNLKNAHESATLILLKLIYHLNRAYCDMNEKNPVAIRCKRYLDLHLTESLLLEDLAHNLGKSRSQLIRIFYQTYHCTPYRYFLSQKLELAKIMLCNSGKNIGEIANDLSFSDAYYFSNLFKRKFGMAPDYFRKNYHRIVRKGESELY